MGDSCSEVSHISYGTYTSCNPVSVYVGHISYDTHTLVIQGVFIYEIIMSCVFTEGI